MPAGSSGSQCIWLRVKLIGNRMYRMLELPPLRRRIHYLPSCDIDFRFTLILSHRHDYTRQATSVGFPIQILFALFIYPTRDICHDHFIHEITAVIKKMSFRQFLSPPVSPSVSASSI